jgi:hypothetical protein
MCEHFKRKRFFVLTSYNFRFSTNVRGEPVFSVIAAGWFCEKSGWIGKLEDVKLVLLKNKRMSTGNHRSTANHKFYRALGQLHGP